jgi:hypothetical protein
MAHDRSNAGRLLHGVVTRVFISTATQGHNARLLYTKLLRGKYHEDGANDVWSSLRRISQAMDFAGETEVFWEAAVIIPVLKTGLKAIKFLTGYPLH